MRRQSISRATSLQQFLRQILSLKHLKHCILFAVIPALLCYAFTLKVLTMAGFSLGEAIQDSVQQTDTSSWLGLVSNLGVLLTVAAAVICLFVVSIKAASVSKQQSECLFLIGLLSALLAVDDFFLLHDRHVGQNFCYTTYAVCLLLLLYRHHKSIVQIDGPAFLIAGGLFACSILTDLLQSFIPGPDSYVQVFEEGCKFVGMATWLYFSYRFARNSLQANSRSEA